MTLTRKFGPGFLPSTEDVLFHQTYGHYAFEAPEEVWPLPGMDQVWAPEVDAYVYEGGGQVEPDRVPGGGGAMAFYEDVGGGASEGQGQEQLITEDRVKSVLGAAGGAVAWRLLKGLAGPVGKVAVSTVVRHPALTALVGLIGAGVAWWVLSRDNNDNQGPGTGLATGLPGSFNTGAVIGTWKANGITFYRLSDGRMAVQNLRGRWKVWRPKRPIVIMPGGVGSLKSLLRADAVLTAQATQLDKMLNRRVVSRARASARQAALTSGKRK